MRIQTPNGLMSLSGAIAERRKFDLRAAAAAEEMDALYEVVDHLDTMRPQMQAEYAEMRGWFEASRRHYRWMRRRANEFGAAIRSATTTTD